MIKWLNALRKHEDEPAPTSENFYLWPSPSLVWTYESFVEPLPGGQL